ncbi:MAG: aminotransferase class III-fold pyridoxal phosphate-dependent enzyme, partial [Pirellula sp.]
AVEVAWKLAYANRPGFLMRFDLAYHGRSLAIAHISDTRASDALRTQLHVGLHKPQQDSMRREPSAGVVPFPCCGTASKESCEQCDASLAATRHWLESHAHETSAMIVEPVIGSRGYYFACRNFHRRLAAVLREYQIQIISDEIQMGLGRLGKMLVSHEDGWDADFTVLGKSLGGGVVSIAAVIGQAKKMDALVEGIESETFSANPLGCRVAVESLRLLNDERLMRDVVVNGERFRDRLRTYLPEFLKADGLGLATVIDLAGVPSEVGIASEVAHCWVIQMKECGMLTHLTGARRDRIAFIPPLVIDGASLERATQIAVDFWKSEKNLPGVLPAKHRPSMESTSQ